MKHVCYPNNIKLLLSWSLLFFFFFSTADFRRPRPGGPRAAEGGEPQQRGGLRLPEHGAGRGDQVGVLRRAHPHRREARRGELHHQVEWVGVSSSSLANPTNIGIPMGTHTLGGDACGCWRREGGSTFGVAPRVFASLICHL